MIRSLVGSFNLIIGDHRHDMVWQRSMSSAIDPHTPTPSFPMSRHLRVMVTIDIPLTRPL